MRTAGLIGLLIGMTAAADQPPPAGSVALSPGLYAFRDRDGAPKVARRTPFGWSVQAAVEQPRPAAQPRRLADDPAVAVEEDGDWITFRRRTPFGDQVWRRRRGELTAMEKELVAGRGSPR